MISYILKRLAGMVVVMFLVVTIVFIIVRVTPGDPAAVMLGPDATPQDIVALRARLGLDQSILVQYVFYIGQLLKGDLGQSIFLNVPVGQALLERAEPTFFLTVFSLLIAAVIALPIGIYAAYRRGSFIDQASTTIAMLAASIPSFWLGLILMQIFSVRLGLFPVSGYGGPDASFLDRMYHLTLPAVARSRFLGADPALHPSLHARRVQRRLYPHRPRQGLVERRVVLKHALKNAHSHPDRPRPDSGGADCRCRGDGNGLRPARRRQSRGVGGAEA